MARADWDAPRTEEGLLNVLRRLDECRAAGDIVEVGNGLLALSYLVKWVRSDTGALPFARSHELALQAVEAFRSVGDGPGIVRSLVAAAALADPKAHQAMLAEADALANELKDEDLIAAVLAARARTLAMTNRAQARELQKRVLAIYRRTVNKRGLATCLFSLSIGEEDSTQGMRYAIEAAELYRTLGEFGDAAKCVEIAIMNGRETVPLVELEPLVREGINDAQNAANRGIEGSLYDKLSLICAAKGQFEDAEKYRQWAIDLRDSDGLTPLERWKHDLSMTRRMVSMAKRVGNREAVKAFTEDLKRLKSNRPRP